ncbi:MAG: hypothetical protein IT379_39465 [Deltaproteobacteria bacterium]|nr:hypothetical protein [Deltaproteobacteria bacterium]
MPQTSYLTAPAIGLNGSPADCGIKKDLALAAEGTVPVGIAVVRGTAEEQVKQPAAPAAASATAIIASGFATAATAVTKGTADANGAIGATRIWPPRNLTATFSSHADVDAGTLLLKGITPAGDVVEETLYVPDAGNTTLVGKVCFEYFLEARLSPMAGVGGAVTIGIGTDMGPISGRDVVGASMYDSGKVTQTDYAEDDVVSVRRKGNLFVTSETVTTKGEPVWVRFVAGGAEVRGAFRKDADGSAGAPDACLLRGARWARTITAAGVSEIELDLAAG